MIKSLSLMYFEIEDVIKVASSEGVPVINSLYEVSVLNFQINLYCMLHVHNMLRMRFFVFPLCTHYYCIYVL